MGDDRIKQYWSNEMEAMLQTYKQFQTLLPKKGMNGAVHNGEDGRYVEYVIKEYLKKYLPKQLEVLTGFILRPAVKRGDGDKSRKKDQHAYSSQLDILVYDSYSYPVYQRFGDSVIVPPEGVVAVLSIKKHMRAEYITDEIEALSQAAYLCRQKNRAKELVRGPYLGLLSMKTLEKKSGLNFAENIFHKMKDFYEKDSGLRYDSMVDLVASFSQWSITKGRPLDKKEAEFMYIDHGQGQIHVSFQLLLHGILSVYYDKTRNDKIRPGFTDLSGIPYNKSLGNIKYSTVR